MTPHDTANFWIGFILLGVPLIALTGGPYGWRFLILLGALAGLASHPLITGAAIGLPAPNPAPVGGRGADNRLRRWPWASCIGLAATEELMEVHEKERNVPMKMLERARIEVAKLLLARADLRARF
jgi:hypothetical protein